MLKPIQPRSRTWTVKITLSLLVGAVITWAVAWWCALYGALPRPASMIDTTAGSLQWPAPPPDAWRDPTASSTSVARLITRQSYGLISPGHHLFHAEQSEFGWPFRSLRSVHFMHLSDAAITEQRRFSLPAPRLWLSPLNRYLPLAPMPMGFALNTLLAAALILGLIESAALARRTLRARRNRCPFCNYDRRGLAPAAHCPECGMLNPAARPAVVGQVSPPSVQPPTDT